MSSRAPIALAPATASDRTCLAIFGVPWRTLRAWLAVRAIPITRIGRRSVVRVDAVLAALEGTEARPAWSEAEVIAQAARAGRR